MLFRINIHRKFQNLIIVMAMHLRDLLFMIKTSSVSWFWSFVVAWRKMHNHMTQFASKCKIVKMKMWLADLVHVYLYLPVTALTAYCILYTELPVSCDGMN